MFYKVWLRSVPGMYEQYVTYVTVHAENEEEAIRNAKIQVKYQGFPDRTPSMWKADSVEILDER